ncbi:ZrgA family zinc uptake protein [Candidatus Foliamicus sp.]
MKHLKISLRPRCFALCPHPYGLRNRFGSANFRSLLYAMAIGSLIPVQGPAQHVHGVIELGIVVEGDAVAVSLTAPLSDVVGFEHPPESDEQLERIENAAAMFSSAEAMFGLADSANCTVSTMSVDGPEYVTKHLAEHDAGAAEGDEHHHDTHDSHGGGSAHDQHHDEHHDEHAESNGHDHDDSTEHADMIASYEWACANISELESIELRFTESLASVDKIDIQILTAEGAQAITAEGRAASVSLLRP